MFIVQLFIFFIILFLFCTLHIHLYTLTHNQSILKLLNFENLKMKVKVNREGERGEVSEKFIHIEKEKFIHIILRKPNFPAPLWFSISKILNKKKL